MQLALYEAGRAGEAGRARRTREASGHQTRLCAACSAREARYGFRSEADNDAALDRPRTLCFECFRMEMDKRRIDAAQLARGWNATQPELPLASRLETLARRRGRAQIAARRALELK